MANSGFVGFFDILGYQNIIENNEIDEVSLLISDLLLKLPQMVKTEMASIVTKNAQDLLFKALDEIEVRLISDSLIFTTRIDKKHELHVSRSNTRSILILEFITILCKELFNNGLPVRGVIDFGEFFLKENCFAGKPLIKCFQLSQKLQLAGTILTQDAKEKFTLFLERCGDSIESYGSDYLIPLKDKDVQKAFLLDTWQGLEKTDVREYVYESFHAHNKDVPLSVYEKIENTEFAIRHMLMVSRNKMNAQSKAEYEAGELTSQ